MPQLSPSDSWKRIRPWVESALKSGACEPMRNVMMTSPGRWLGCCRKRRRHNRNQRERIRRLGRFDRDEVWLGVLLAVEPLGHRQTLRAQKIGVEQLRLVAVAGVTEERDDGMARAQLAGEAHRAGDIHARRRSETQAFMLEQVEADRDRFRIGNLERVIDRQAFEIGGGAGPAGALRYRTSF